MARRISLPTILVDTREQQPWTFRARAIVEARGEMPLRAAKLDQGDYSVDGLTSVISIERKSLHDFVNSCTGKDKETGRQNRERFWEELVRLRPLQYRAVIVEGSLDQVWAHTYRSNADPLSVVRSASAIMFDHGIPVIWAGSRHDAELEAAWWLWRAWRDHRPRGGDGSA